MDYSKLALGKHAELAMFWSKGVEGARHLSKASMRLGLAALTLLVACEPNEPEDPCSIEEAPAFTITVRAKDGPLPPDTRIRLVYGGGYEDFALDRSDQSPLVMFCETDMGTEGSAGAAGAPQASVSSIACDLWIEGAATVSVTGGDFPELLRELEGEANECGPETVKEELVLGETEAESE